MLVRRSKKLLRLYPLPPGPCPGIASLLVSHTRGYKDSSNLVPGSTVTKRTETGKIACTEFGVCIQYKCIIYLVYYIPEMVSHLSSVP